MVLDVEVDKSLLVQYAVSIKISQEVTFDIIEKLNKILSPYNYAANMVEYPVGMFYCLFFKDHPHPGGFNVVLENPLEFANHLADLSENLLNKDYNKRTKMVDIG